MKHVKHVIRALRGKFLSKIRNPRNTCNICKAYMKVFKSREYNVIGTPCSTCTNRWRRFLRRFYRMIVRVVE